MSTGDESSVCSSGQSAVSVRTNGPFRWNEAKNTLLLRELYSSEPFLYKVGSKEAGQKWTEVAEKLNCFSLFRDMPRDQRSVREQFNKLLKDYKNKKNKEEKASGINPDPPTENETLLEEIVEAMESTTLRVGNANRKKDDQKRKDALACRDKAMTTWAKAGASGEASDSGEESATEKKTVQIRRRKRRASSDPFQYLAEKTAKETDLRKEELDLQRQQLQLQAEQQKEQFKVQQEQMKQMMQSQMNTQNLVLALVQKLTK